MGNTDFNGWAAQGGLSYAINPLTIRGSLAYGSGDDNANDDKDKQFETYLGNDQHYTFIYEYQVVSEAGRLNSGLSNTTYLNLGLDWAATKDVTASLDGYYLRAAKANEAIGNSTSKSIGWEVDGKVVYTVARNLKYQVDAGFFDAGKIYGDDKKNAAVLRHTLTLSF